MSSVKAKAGGLEPLAMSMVLPHERRAMRMPVVPATFTALLETMGNKTIPVPGGTRRAFLCRDACYPLWMERNLYNSASYLQSIGSATTWTVPAEKNKQIQLPRWDAQSAYALPANGAPAIDNAPITVGNIVDLTPIAVIDTWTAIYIPLGSTFEFKLSLGAAGAAGSTIEAEFGYVAHGEVNYSTIQIPASIDGYEYLGLPGGPLTGTTGEGVVPYGFTWLRSWRTGVTVVTAGAAPALQFGWTTGGSILALNQDKPLLLLPAFTPPEFNNSTIPYRKTRLNASAALFTNVTSVMQKEGTVLAARLNPATIDPWSFGISDIDSTHPKLRYYGPLEKGLYTFTTPGGNIDTLDDLVLGLSSPSTVNGAARPLFSPLDMGIYNAIIFTDTNVVGDATILAVSCYAHIEYETTSSLFPIGVSTLTLETLHAAEVALLGFGHFHENPIHWAALTSAATAVLRKVAPMVAPVVAHYGQMAVNKGVEMLKGYAGGGDRKMTQVAMQAPRKVPAKPKAKAGKGRKRKGK